jgi:hypothetical protein
VPHLLVAESTVLLLLLLHPMLQIADAVENTIISALLGPNHTAVEEEELRRKYRAGALPCAIPHDAQTIRLCFCLLQSMLTGFRVFILRHKSLLYTGCARSTGSLA